MLSNVQLQTAAVIQLVLTCSVLLDTSLNIGIYDNVASKDTAAPNHQLLISIEVHQLHTAAACH